MRKIMTYISIVMSFVCSCDTNNAGNLSNTVNPSQETTSLSDDEYFAQQASKNNQNDTLLLGLNIGMNEEQVLSQLEKEGAWRFYSTRIGKERLDYRGLGTNVAKTGNHLKKENESIFKNLIDPAPYKEYSDFIYEGPEMSPIQAQHDGDYLGKRRSDKESYTEAEWQQLQENHNERVHLRGFEANEVLPVDSYGMDDAFISKVILKSEDGRFSEDTITILLDFYENKLLSVKVCAFGSLHEYAEKCNDEIFNTLKATLVEKYGNPYKENHHLCHWVNGSTHIILTFEGIKKLKDSSIHHPYHFAPLAQIYYSDWLFTKKVEGQEKLKQQDELRQNREIDSLNQERLRKEYKGL